MCGKAKRDLQKNFPSIQYGREIFCRFNFTLPHGRHKSGNNKTMPAYSLSAYFVNSNIAVLLVLSANSNVNSSLNADFPFIVNLNEVSVISESVLV